MPYGFNRSIQHTYQAIMTIFFEPFYPWEANCQQSYVLQKGLNIRRLSRISGHPCFMKDTSRNGGVPFIVCLLSFKESPGLNPYPYPFFSMR